MGAYSCPFCNSIDAVCFPVFDGSQIFLASTIMVDRNGKQYHGSIEPDATIKLNDSSKTDETLEAAIKWLKSEH